MVEMEQLTIRVRKGDKYIQLTGDKAWRIVSYSKLDKEVTRMLEQKEAEDRKNGVNTSNGTPTGVDSEAPVPQVT